MSKHTPPPWKLYGDPSKGLATIKGADGEKVSIPLGPDDETFDANVSIQLAAPDMLEALEAAESWWTALRNDNAPIVQQIRSAIAKAKGEDTNAAT